jgi:hypothetical protein
LDRAIAQGVVNWRIDPQWPATKDAELGLLQRLHPGLTYKIGLRTGWGQVNEGAFKSKRRLFHSEPQSLRWLHPCFGRWDRCGLMPGRSDRTEYDAVRCGDESAIEEALDHESPSRKGSGRRP